MATELRLKLNSVIKFRSFGIQKMLKFLLHFILIIGYEILNRFDSFLLWGKKSLLKKVNILRNSKKIVVPKMPTYPKVNLVVPKINIPQFRVPSLSVKKFTRGFTFLYGIIFALLFIMLPFELHKWFIELPNPNLLVNSNNYTPTKIVDRNGRLLYEIYTDKKSEPVKLDKVPELVIKATLAVEDADFYKHQGISIKSIIRALKVNTLEEDLQGGSTITQQLIKNVLLSPERTIERKLKEIALALMVEQRFSKDQILELYLNNTPYGGSAWGIQTASQKYFGKNVNDLNLAEASMLAGLPKAPTTYSPLANFDIAKQRQQHVLDRMVSLNYISRDEAKKAFDSELKLIEQAEYIRAPHFVAYIRQQLEEKYGKRFVDFGGLTIVTTLDLDLQEKTQKIVFDEIEKSKSLNISNGAAVVMDSRTGELLSYVGSKDYFIPGWGVYDIATAYRQPGSSIKPLTYSLALTNGYTAASVINDSPMIFKVQGAASYRPVNYDGKYHGNITLRQALANSYNIPAVYLASKIGPDNIVKAGKDAGLSGWDIDGSYGLSITLGGKEVRLLDLTNMYATFARSGEYKTPKAIIEIKDQRGFNIYQNDDSTKSVFSKEVSYLIWHILSDNKARQSAFGVNNALVVPNHNVAVKTGTTDAKRDNWTLGFTPSYTVGVWVGNNDNTPMNPRLASGLSGAAPIWNKIMVQMLDGKTNEPFDLPSQMYVKSDDGCSRSEVFIKGSNVPKSLCGGEKDEKRVSL